MKDFTVDFCNDCDWSNCSSCRYRECRKDLEHACKLAATAIIPKLKEEKEIAKERRNSYVKKSESGKRMKT